MAKKKKEVEEVKATTAPVEEVAYAGEAAEEFEKTVMDLIFDQPFYANLIMGMRREFTNALPTLGVNVTDQVNLFINPYFFMSMTPLERIDVLKHECHHVINNHFTRFRDIEPKMFDKDAKKSIIDKIQDMQNMSTTNKAADAAINEYLPNLPKKMKFFDKEGNPVCVPTEIKDDKGNVIPNPDKKAGKPIEGSPILVSLLKKKYPDILATQTMEYYYEYLKQKQEEDKQNGGGGGIGDMVVIDDHDIWHQSDATEEQITQAVKDAVNTAAEKTGERSMGKLPGEVQSALDKLNHVPKDWRGDVQNFCARTSEIKADTSRKKRNRRYGIYQQGTITYPKLNITVAIDSSGSVSDECLSQFHAEIGRLYNMGISITIIECDAQVQAMYKFDPKKPFVVHGRGGTAFKPVFDYIETSKIETDALLYFTDGCCYGESIKRPNYPVLWCLTPPFQLDASVAFGKKTKIEIKKKVWR